MSQTPDLTVVRQISPEITTFSVPFTKFGVLKTGGRATLVKLASGSLAIISAVHPSTIVQDAIEEKGGDVKYIIAPNLEHYLHIGKWKELFPKAKIIGSDLLALKCASHPLLKDIKFDVTYTTSDRQPRISEEFDKEFNIEYVNSIPSQEIVIYHKASKTLIEADLLFNIPSTEQFSKSETSATSGIIFRFLSPLLSAKPPAVWQRRLAWRLVSAENRGSFSDSIHRINSWDFDRIIPCHGDVIETQGKPVFQDIFHPFLAHNNTL